MRPVTFPDGTRVRAGPLVSGRTGPADFGIYAYGQARRRPSRLGMMVNRLTGRALHGGSWAPAWDAEWIHWPDFGVPADDSAAARAIFAAYRRAQRGEIVEVACYGGIGRTGTVLACMAVLAGVADEDVVAWVRANYSPSAVERDPQRQWVEWFAHEAELLSDGTHRCH